MYMQGVTTLAANLLVMQQLTSTDNNSVCGISLAGIPSDLAAAATNGDLTLDITHAYTDL